MSEKPLRLLVAWSPTAPGPEALECAAWLARTADVRVRCITTLLRPWPSTSIAKLGNKYKKWIKKEQAAYEQAATRALEEAGIGSGARDKKVAVLSDGTNEAAMLSEAAAEFGADMIIMGAAATAPKGKFMAGTTADAMLHGSPRPLALAPRAPRLSKRGVTRVNFAYIGQETDPAALLRAAQLATRWKVGLRILAISPNGFGVPPISDSLKLPVDFTHEWRENALAALDRARDEVAKAFPELGLETDLGSGTGWAGALDAVRWKKGDLLCLGSAPLGAFERVFVGSQTTEILKHVQVPVLMIPNGGQGR
ncbi:universal stress protein [Corynebacterium sp. 153RC1]|uniref:universal stress protein n=1 Tax=unclassified Corynebacterium TaxID=2624378 RepID=UPI00211C23ED|nr:MULTISPECIES: universal stress protein [unclassified Corynebacterium]MCQ9371416.1 universal stress protein [Corynebacterium sp. 35RC1]MCQ9353346.1 universal stress protein [Corynebacterium sp. 209RC1]MCQ9355601.1 universal stress protein [Corynebacterium sp. 1222RC1]MCQ9357785.1 universal stress protein [Corynebacterium sp. 122RC1]MCQ9359990.1 universal stress protein [Corynebacterium sp. 142RC1]